ncbi:MAG: formyltetrahydrofolate deformylase [Rickettsiales bacterium]|nr:formyltetrahydrofolate deformylase [Rickettsiales bacterium]
MKKLSEKTYILKLSCADKKGIVASVSGFLLKNNGFILESAQFGDESTGKFFLRAEFTCPLKIEILQKKFEEEVAKNFAMEFVVFDKSERPKILIAVSKASHCLVDLLHKNEIGVLNAEIVGVVSNHKDLEIWAKRFNKKFYYLPIGKDKNLQEKKLFELFKKTNSDLLILARYMQILSDDFCKKSYGKIINIHHSFLPSFKGAKPYHQAFDRGVKLIGATAHYATENLDEGPIIEQEVTRVNHSYKAEDLKLAGQDIENRVLFRAVKWHLEHRVIINGNKSVVFN